MRLLPDLRVRTVALQEESAEKLPSLRGTSNNLGAVAPDVCYRCHGDKTQLQEIAGPHQIGGENCFNCTTCHDPHGNIVESSRKDLCLECHNQSPLQAWHSSTHDQVGVACTDCHNPHPDSSVRQVVNVSHTSVQRPKRLPMSVNEPQACYKCHPKIKGRTMLPSHHPIREGKVTCSDCHDPHGESERNLKGETVNMVCYKCHAEKQGPFVYQHPPVEQDCNICHEPHGTVAYNLLRQPPTFLCLRCHTGHRSAPADHFGQGVADAVAPRILAVRTGWWGMSTAGSSTRVGQYQSLKPAPFWDVDGLLSDGQRTADFYATGLDSETTMTGLRFYGPLMQLDFEYERFLSRLLHDPLDGFADIQEQQPGGDFYVKEDLNVGEDYAVRVQQLKANFKGHLTKNINWGLNIWGFRKTGERQVTSMAHCFNVPNGTDPDGNPVSGPVFGNSCHSLSQRQRIDWLTTEVKPMVEANFGAATVRYSRTMRTLSTDDQVTTRPYDNFGFSGDLPYASVPENYTEIDRLKLSGDLLTDLHAYAQLYNGNTLNRSRRINRRFHGYDLRLTSRAIAGTSLTGYAKQYVQSTQTPTTLLPEENPADIHPLFAYDQTTAGLKGRWRPYDGEYSWRSRFLISSGYEYRGMERPNSVYLEPGGTASQFFTASNLFHVRASMQWNRSLDSFVRYRLGFYDDPLYGIAKNGTTNTLLPTQSHLIELGTTWSPTDALVLTGVFGIDNSWNKSDLADFQNDSYPIVLSAWYSPTPCWSVSGGLAFFRSWIDQDVTLGSLNGSAADPVTSRWNYGGQSDVVNLGTTYAWSDRLTLTGGFEFARGRNSFASPALWPDLPQYSNVVIETTRWRAGFDYLFCEDVSGYFRYQLFDYNDETQNYLSGTANMVLGGISAVY